MQGTSQSLEPEIKPTHTDTTKTDKIFIASYAMPNIPPKRYGATVPRYRCRRTYIFLACSVGGGSGSGAISHRPIASSGDDHRHAPAAVRRPATRMRSCVLTWTEQTFTHTHTPDDLLFRLLSRSCSALCCSVGQLHPSLPRLALHFFNRFIATGSHLHTIKTANRLCFAQ